MICIFLCATFLTKAQENSQLSKGDSLYKNGAWFSAAIAYERVLFDHANTENYYKAVTCKVACLKKQGRFADITPFLNASIDSRITDSTWYALKYEQVIAGYLCGQYENSLTYLQELSFRFPGKTELPLLTITRILCLNELQRWKEAEQAYLAWTHIDSTAATNPYRHMPHFKNAEKAQWLSMFIPGAGQWYAGRPWEGLASMLIQGASIWYGITCWQDHYHLSALLVGGGLFGSFHKGGVKRSEDLVLAYNHKIYLQFNEQIKLQLVQQMKQAQKNPDD